MQQCEGNLTPTGSCSSLCTNHTSHHEFLGCRQKARLKTCDNIQHIWCDHHTKAWTKSPFKQCESRFMATTHQTTKVSGRTRNASFYYVYRKMSLWLWHRFDKVVKHKASICEDMTFFSSFFCKLCKLFFGLKYWICVMEWWKVHPLVLSCYRIDSRQRRKFSCCCNLVWTVLLKNFLIPDGWKQVVLFVFLLLLFLYFACNEMLEREKIKRCGRAFKWFLTW